MSELQELESLVMQDWDKYRRRSGMVIVLSGPSGVGKDAVLEEFIREWPDVRKCVTATTRAPRPNEQAGKDYHFVTIEEFRRMVDENRLLEYAEVYGNLYGTPKDWVESQVEAGHDVVLKIDVQGGISVKKQLPEAIMVFLVPPSLEELERRLTSRMTESAADLTKRILNARSELEHIDRYDYIVENDVVDEAVATLRSIIVAERSRVVPSS